MCFLGDIITGDEILCFPGEIIVGITSVDASWWKGSVDGRSGIFPLTFVKELISTSVEDTHKSQSESKVESIPPGQSESSSSEARSPMLLSSAAGKEKPVARARATQDLDAQLDDELSLRKDDVIEVFRMVDDVFALGRTGDRIGQFPLAFVEIFEGSLETLGQVETDSAKVKSKFDWWQDPNAEEMILNKKPYLGGAEPTPSFEEQTAPISAEEEYSLKTSHAFYSKPGSNSETFVEDLAPVADSLLDRGIPGASVKVAEGAQFARTLFAFAAENDNELGFGAGELVTVIGHVDDQWMEGELCGRRGIFPGSYVELCDGYAVQHNYTDGAIQPPVAEDVHISDKPISSLKAVKVDTTLHKMSVVDGSVTQNSSAFQQVNTCEEKVGAILPSTAEDVPSDRMSAKLLLSPEVAEVDTVCHQMCDVGAERDVITTQCSMEFQPVNPSGETIVPSHITENSSQSPALEGHHSDLPMESPGIDNLPGSSVCCGADSRLDKRNSVAGSPTKGQDSDSVNSEAAELQSAVRTVTENPQESVADVADSPLVEAAESADAALDKDKTLLKSALDKVLSELTSKFVSSESKPDGNDSVSHTLSSVCKVQQSSRGQDLSANKQEVVACDSIVTNGAGTENSEMTNGSLVHSPTPKVNLNSSDPATGHTQRQKSEKPAIKPKPKPKPDFSSHPVKNMIYVASVPKKPSVKKGVSFCENVTVFPVDLESDFVEGKNEDSRAQFQRKSLDFESVPKTFGKLELERTAAESQTASIASPTSPTSPTASCKITSGEVATVHFRKESSPAPSPKSVRAALSLSPKKQPPLEKETKKETGGLKIGQSLFYNDVAEASVAPSLASPVPSTKLPPRPTKPRPSTTQGNAPLPNGIFYTSELEENNTKPVPCRPAPPRPQSTPPRPQSMAPVSPPVTPEGNSVCI